MGQAPSGPAVSPSHLPKSNGPQVTKKNPMPRLAVLSLGSFLCPAAAVQATVNKQCAEPIEPIGFGPNACSGVPALATGQPPTCGWTGQTLQQCSSEFRVGACSLQRARTGGIARLCWSSIGYTHDTSSTRCSRAGVLLIPFFNSRLFSWSLLCCSMSMLFSTPTYMFDSTLALPRKREYSYT